MLLIGDPPDNPVLNCALISVLYKEDLNNSAVSLANLPVISSLEGIKTYVEKLANCSIFQELRLDTFCVASNTELLALPV